MVRREENQSMSLDVYGSGRENPAKRTNQRGGKGTREPSTSEATGRGF